MNKAYRIAIPLMVAWLVACIFLSWAFILDDALIHLRYADNLLHTHQITYDGIHPNYGASSLLYVSLLAVLRSFITSPNLPRGVSSIAHLLLFCGIAALLVRSIPRQATRVRLLGLILLLILIVPSAIRWLDDGMETGLVLCFTSLLCWLSFRESKRTETTVGRYLGLVVLGFFIVLLRTELSMICAVACAILALTRVSQSRGPKSLQSWLKAGLNSSHLLVGAVLALAVIVLKMHVLLPDTALAKSHGFVSPILVAKGAAHALVGGLTLGVGMFLLWLITLFLVLRFLPVTLPLLLANIPFVLTLLLVSLRGQEIQGIRYLEWTLLFSTLWNILELGAASPEAPGIERDVAGKTLAYALLVLMLVVQPLEYSIVRPIISDRAKLMARLPGQHLDVLQGKLGVAADVGIIGYFSKANLCDISGLVNGREFARLNGDERQKICATENPDFLFLDLGEIESFHEYMAFGDWQVCGEYAMTAFWSKDIHYLIVPKTTAEQICRETRFSHPYAASEAIALSKATDGGAHPAPPGFSSAAAY